MPTIALITDRSKNDFYTSAVKGRFLSAIENVEFLEISERTPMHQIETAAFMLRYLYMNFPEKTIFVIGIKSEPAPDIPIVIAEKNKRFFIGADNGIFSLALEYPDKLLTVSAELYPENTSFMELTLFPQLAAAVSQNGLPDQAEGAQKAFNRCPQFLPVLDNNSISGKVIYIDSYKNAITNIDKKLFEQVGKGRRFEIMIQSNRNKIVEINNSYRQSAQGELLALFNHINLLEIATYESPAAELLGLNLSSAVRVNFFNDTVQSNNPTLF